MMSKKVKFTALHFFLFCSFALGIAISKFIPQLSIYIVGLTVSSIAVFIFYRKKKIFLSDVSILLVFFMLGGIWSIADNSSRSLNRFLGKENIVTFKVVSLPQDKKSRNTLVAEVAKVNGIEKKSKITVIDYSKSLQFLHTYQINGKLNKIKYNSSRIYLWVKKDSAIDELPMDFLDKMRFNISNYVTDASQNYLSNKAYRFLSSTLLGRKELFTQERQAFSSTGISHLLAISGLHVGLIAAIFYYMLRLFHLPFRLRLYCSAVFLITYAFVTGLSISVVRSVIMYLIFTIGFLLKRRLNLFNTLGLAGLIILLIQPTALFQVAFQLSFLSVYALCLGFNLFPLRRDGASVIMYIKSILYASFFVTVAITPIISYNFGSINVLGILYNVFFIPLFSLVLFINILFILLSSVAIIAQSLGAVISLLVSIFLWVVNKLAAFRFSSFPVEFNFVQLSLYYLILVGFLVFLFKRKQRERLDFQGVRE